MKKRRRRSGRKTWRVVGRSPGRRMRAITIHAPNAGIAMLHFVLRYPEFWVMSCGPSKVVARRIYKRV